MRFLGVTRAAFISTAAALLAACSGGYRFLTGGSESDSLGTWRVERPDPKLFKGSKGVALFSLRLPLPEAKGRAVSGQLLAADTSPHAACELSSGRKRPLLFAIRVPVYQIAVRGNDKGASGYIAATSGTFSLRNFARTFAEGLATAASGPLAFQPNPDYRQSLEHMGMAPSTKDLVQLAFAHATISDVLQIKGAIADADLETVSRFRLFGYSGEDAVRLKQIMPSLTAEELLSLAGVGATAEYIERLRLSAVETPTVEDVRRARLTDYMRGYHGI